MLVEIAAGLFIAIVVISVLIGVISGIRDGDPDGTRTTFGGEE